MLFIGIPLALASLKGDDPWIVVPMLVISWTAFMYMCFIHKGHRRWRAGAAVGISAVICLIGIRLYLKAASLSGEAAKTALSEPTLQLEPESLQYSPVGKAGEFTITLVNTGIDVNYIGVQQDYFLAEQNLGVTISRLFKMNSAPSSVAPPMRINQGLTIGLSFNGLVRQLYDGLRKSGRLGILGVRLTITFCRYSDQKSFRMVRAFEAWGNNLEMLSAPGDRKSPTGGPFILEQVMPYIEADDHWRDPIFHLKPDGNVSIVENLR